MRAELLIKGKSLTGTSDLTLLAPIIPGFVPSLDAVTYKTRAKRLLKTLQGGRASLHEYAAYRPLSDAVERVAVIHSFRVAVLEPENKILLAVTFDGTWESYIRVLWQRVGTLLDVIFCNSVDYALSTDSFEAWTDWVRRVQVETSFFFTTHALTVDDAQYLRSQEFSYRRITHPSDPEPDVAAARTRVVRAEDIAQASINSPAAAVETVRQGLQSLAVLFRFTDAYLPGTSDGGVLQRAARDLLLEFISLIPTLPSHVRDGMRVRFARQLDWLVPADVATVNRPREVPPLPDKAPTDMHGDVQGGILRSYDDATHGCLVLVAFDRPAAGAELLDELLPGVTTEADATSKGLKLNLALTYEGLRALGLTEGQLAWFPQEFREGMEARASMLGDFRTNHPRRWRLPERNWDRAPDAAPLRVEMSTVHMVLQWRVADDANNQWPVADDPNQWHPLRNTVAQWFGPPGAPGTRPGVRVLSVQWMKRQVGDKGQTQEHFGFADGGSQPVLNAAQSGPTYPNQVHLGEFLLGYENEADFPPQAASDADRARAEFLRNGSFLVVRKLRQRVQALRDAVARAAQRTGLDDELILAKMMGRKRDGTPLVAPGTPKDLNDFNYDTDKQGSLCPFHAHIRRTNPRNVGLAHHEMPGRRRPRVMRRGMSYGPRYEDRPSDDADRGLMFMAYNASICEQFEVVQRWISGGNSAGGYSQHSDPFLGVPEVGQTRFYRFEHRAGNRDQVFRVALDASPAPNAEPEPYVRLEWGSYLFVPSMSTLRALEAMARTAGPPAPTWDVAVGEDIIRGLQRLAEEHDEATVVQAWKAVLEDPDAQEKYKSASVWAAIRASHDGVLDTPYGVIVADRDLVKQVLEDQQSFSVSGYHERMQRAKFEIFLGLDPSDPRYAAQSDAVNGRLMDISMSQAFDKAYAATAGALARFLRGEQEVARQLGQARWELNLDVKEVCDLALARLCQEWFGLPAARDDPNLVPGSWRWDWKPGEACVYPSQFTAPSRYFFQPHPGAEVADYGEQIGEALVKALAAFLQAQPAGSRVPKAPDGSEAPIAKTILAGNPEPAIAARTFAGVLMGFLPTVDGSLRLALNEWLRDGTFWSLRAAWAAHAAPTPFERAMALLKAPLIEAMQLRPTPELIWRTVARAGVSIGSVPADVGRKVVLALVSAAQQDLADGRDDVSPIFGGQRRASGPPTHACPAYEAGMGVLFGMLAAMLAVTEDMRPSPAPLAFTFEGRLAPP